jgi:predicted ATPase/DNA-binding winged helix-turn-helix (wHTH) protein
VSDQGRSLVYESGQWQLHLGRRELLAGGVAVPIGARAFEIIELLVRSANELVTKNDIMSGIWPGAIVGENTLQVHISAIRKALGRDRGILKTASGRGYRLIGDWTPRQLGLAGQPVASPLAREPSAPLAKNFPLIAGRLIGRAVAAQRVRDLVSAYRVVTLTGPGGIGKTSLAIEAARCLLADFDGGGWFVELASLSTPDLVPSAVASALGLKLSGEISAESVARAVGAKHLLIVLDNCEHVIDAAADLAERLTRLCPNTAILTTSREVLRIRGEAVYRVPPLDVPALGLETPDHILGHSAVELFISRLTALGVGFSSHAEELTSLAAICRHLDGIPLAIEFAAASSATLGIAAVAKGLGDRFALLSYGRRSSLARHRTLRATFDWSHELLPEPEQRLFRRLAKFHGGFTLDAAVAVMSDTGLNAGAVTDGIANLVTKSLVALDTTQGATRWHLLETIRAYALEKLGESQEATQTARAHAAFFRDLIVSAAPISRSDPALSSLAVCLREIGNVRAALDWSFSAAGDSAIGVPLTAAYVSVWHHSGLPDECRQRAEQALDGLDPDMRLSERLRLQLHFGFGLAAVFTMRPVDKVRKALTIALDIAESLNDLNAQLEVMYGLWMVHYYSGETRSALSLAERMSVVASSVGEAFAMAIPERFIGNTLHHEGDQRGAQDRFERIIARSVALASRRSSFFPQVDHRVYARASLARVLLLRGYLDQAAEQARLSLEEATATGHELIICQTLRLAVCPVALVIGDFAGAERSIARLVDIANDFNTPLWKSSARCLEARLLIERGAFEAGSALLRSELDACKRTGWTNWYPEFLGVLAEGLAGLGRFPEALASIDDALAKADQGGERYYVAELLRLKGEFLLVESYDEHTTAIEDCFWSALAAAQHQGALFFELRIALSIAGLRASQGRRHEARALLASVYNRFTEGFATAPLQAARTMLDTLAS